MKKLRCYPKTTNYISIFMLIISIIICVVPLIKFEEDSNLYQIIWIIITLLCILYSIFCLIHYSQYIYVKNDKIVLRCILYKIVELDVQNCYYVVTSLLSNYGRTFISDRWICIYYKDETKFFKYGLSNNKKYKRIQIIYNEENLMFIKNYIEKKENSMSNYLNNLYKEKEKKA